MKTLLRISQTISSLATLVKLFITTFMPKYTSACWIAYLEVTAEVAATFWLLWLLYLGVLRVRNLVVKRGQTERNAGRYSSSLDATDVRSRSPPECARHAREDLALICTNLHEHER